MGKIILITGGVNSGKSDFAEYLAKSYLEITYVALSEPRPKDILWQKKIKIHKLKRPEYWNTIETLNLLPILESENNTLLIDSIGGFVLNLLNKNDEDWYENLNQLRIKLLGYKKEIIIVGEQVGLGLVSEYELSNRFINRLGDVLKEITKIANQNWLTINGRAIQLDNMYIDIPKS